MCEVRARTFQSYLSDRPNTDVPDPKFVATDQSFRGLYEGRSTHKNCRGVATGFAAWQMALAAWIARSAKFIWVLGALHHRFTA
jgi:hypothetical protein